MALLWKTTKEAQCLLVWHNMKYFEIRVNNSAHEKDVCFFFIKYFTEDMISNMNILSK